MAGFTGYYLSKALINAGYEVHGMGANPSQEANYHQLDLSDVEAMRNLVAQIQPTVVVHLAAIAFVGHADPEAFYRVNLIGTHHLLSVLAESAAQIYMATPTKVSCMKPKLQHRRMTTLSANWPWSTWPSFGYPNSP